MTERMLKQKIICICQLCTELFCLLTEIFGLGTTNVCVNNTSGLTDYGKDCVFDIDCTTGFCINLLCSCPSDLNYDSCEVACVNGTSYGHDCNVTEQCVIGFICTGICDCLTGYFYDKATTTCSRKLQYGSYCNSTEQCYSGLGCYTGTCNCTSYQYYDFYSSTCSARLANGSTCSNSGQCFVDLICTGNKCGCGSDQFYDTSSAICRSRYQHVNSCSRPEVCMIPLTCKKDYHFDLRCLCPDYMYSYNNVCCSDTELQATMSSNTVINDNSVELYWTTRARITNLSYNVTWTYSPYSVILNFTTTKSSYIKVEGLRQNTEYTIKITTNVPSDIYYSSKAIPTYFNIVTKRSLSYSCSNSSQCSEHRLMTCSSGTCQCLPQYYYHMYRCVSRLNKGSQCSSDYKCKVTLSCIEDKCQCSTGYYYDYTQQSCFMSHSAGESCDPSFEDTCKTPELKCGLSLNENIYKCLENNNLHSMASSENANTLSTTNIALIVATVVGWVAAVAAFVTIFILCGRNKQKQTTNIQKDPVTSPADINNRRGNEYQNFHQIGDQTSDTYVNSPNVTFSDLEATSGGNPSISSGHTEPPIQSAKPKTKPKAFSPKANSPEFLNIGYEVEAAEGSLYEEINPHNNTTYNNVDTCYANVNPFPKN